MFALTQHCCLSSLFSQSVRIGNFSSSPPDAAVRKAHRSLPEDRKHAAAHFQSHGGPSLSPCIWNSTGWLYKRKGDLGPECSICLTDESHGYKSFVISAAMDAPMGSCSDKRVHIFHPALWPRQLHQCTFTLRYNLTRQKMLDISRSIIIMKPFDMYVGYGR